MMYVVLSILFVVNVLFAALMVTEANYLMASFNGSVALLTALTLARS
jgi:hypothetical protein